MIGSVAKAFLWVLVFGLLVCYREGYTPLMIRRLCPAHSCLKKALLRARALACAFLLVIMSADASSEWPGSHAQRNAARSMLFLRHVPSQNGPSAGSMYDIEGSLSPKSLPARNPLRRDAEDKVG